MTWYDWLLFALSMVNGGFAIVNAYFLLVLWDHCGHGRRIIGLVVIFLCARDFIRAIIEVIT